MIYEYNRGDIPLLSYAKNLSFLDKTIEFKEGLNLLVGPNGSGKTTLINTLAYLFFCEQQGYPKFNGVIDFGQVFRNLNCQIESSDIVKHNGLPVVFNKKYTKSQFDDDNFENSIESIFVQANHSAGEVQKYELNKIADYMDKLQSYKKLINEFKKRVNSSYQEKCDSYWEWFKENRVEGSKKLTMLLDEPTSNMDIASRLSYWKTLQKIADTNFQIIVAVHDVTPLIFNKDYHIIETEKEYYSKHLEPYLKKIEELK